MLRSCPNKSKVLGLGGWKERRIWPLLWLQTVLELKIFGFQVLQTYQETLNRNWSTLVESIRNVIMSFQLRALDTLHQRVDCLKIYILSKLVYKMSSNCFVLNGVVWKRLGANLQHRSVLLVPQSVYFFDLVCIRHRYGTGRSAPTI